MGSEMCIRDRRHAAEHDDQAEADPEHGVDFPVPEPHPADLRERCLLYTSDAADERSSVDLGGRRIITNKKEVVYSAYIDVM